MKRSLIYLGAVIVIAIFVIAIEDPFRPRVSDTRDNYFIPDYDSANIAKIEIDQLIEGAVLKRDGDGWQVAEIITPLKEQLLEKEGREEPVQEWRPADKLRITSALGSFGGLDEGVIVSMNPDNHSSYQVGPDGLHVRGLDKDDNPIFDVVIGKNGPDFMSSYIRDASDNKVYLVKKSLMGVFSPHPDDWIEKKKEEAPEEEAAPKAK